MGTAEDLVLELTPILGEAKARAVVTDLVAVVSEAASTAAEKPVRKLVMQGVIASAAFAAITLVGIKLLR